MNVCHVSKLKIEFGSHVGDCYQCQQWKGGHNPSRWDTLFPSFCWVYYQTNKQAHIPFAGWYTFAYQQIYMHILCLFLEYLSSWGEYFSNSSYSMLGLTMKKVKIMKKKMSFKVTLILATINHQFSVYRSLHYSWSWHIL